jgi:hypothetical protein
LSLTTHAGIELSNPRGTKSPLRRISSRRKRILYPCEKGLAFCQRMGYNSQ